MNPVISLAQMHIEPGNLQKNVATAFSMIEKSATRKSTIVLLPELWSSGYDLEKAETYANETPEILKDLTYLAHQYHLSIGGSLLEKSDRGIYNTFYWISPTREILAYRKIHLFRLMEEDRWLNPGDHLQMVSTEMGQAGLAICYDLRFPELFRQYALSGATIFLLSAEWPLKRIHHWQTLLRARAIENLCFLFAVNCVGPAYKDVFGGSSAIISPWGETLAEGSQTDEDLISAQIDPNQVERARGFLPVFQDRRPDLYHLSD
ncbi:carbon-nitrogen family hydrolase [Anaerolinea thermophila]|uniref:Hydrolase n=1 Tax=Anaerolinea thermophila (strain DSM 14523 / JCM 11388 / NBRC 100420 / UNI-1) TaxID=926569 RepID=E8N422_ANATU|nr:carbon-nitrogen family hydrolase [Anaerolinea thermophila]BAJ63186.1 putative hydrolase [Anaerolinea thermophila UNI-1]